MAHLTQDSTFTLGRRLAGLIYADKAKSFGGYTLFAPQTAEGRVYSGRAGRSRASVAASGSRRA